MGKYQNYESMRIGSIEKPIAGLDKSQYGGFSTDEYTFDYEN